jgi:hypothetical protein
MNKKSIYKFYSVNDFALDALENNYLYCNHFTAFNDPFECWCQVNTGIPNHETERDRYMNVIGVWGFTPDRAEEALEYYYMYLEHFEEDEIDHQQYIDSARICCFSNNLSSLLMWSHYADGLRGFCIEFDPDQVTAGDVKGSIINVHYAASPPVLETITLPLANDITWHGEDEDVPGAIKHMNDFYRKMHASKPKEWKYEKEVRLIFSVDNNSTAGEKYYYPPDAIRSVITGEKMSSVNRDNLKKIIKKIQPEAALATANRTRGDYKLSIVW